MIFYSTFINLGSVLYLIKNLQIKKLEDINAGSLTHPTATPTTHPITTHTTQYFD